MLKEAPIACNGDDAGSGEKLAGGNEWPREVDESDEKRSLVGIEIGWGARHRTELREQQCRDQYQSAGHRDRVLPRPSPNALERLIHRS